MGRRPLMLIAFRRFTIDTAVIFGNKENELVVEGGVINLQTICAKAGHMSVPKEMRLLDLRSIQVEKSEVLQKFHSELSVIWRRLLQKNNILKVFLISEKAYIVIAAFDRSLRKVPYEIKDMYTLLMK